MRDGKRHRRSSACLAASRPGRFVSHSNDEGEGMSSTFVADLDLGRGVKIGWVGLLVMVGVVGCGPAEDFQDMEQGEELAEALKLPVSTVAVSSVQPNTNHVGANAVDGNTATRWSSAWSD